MNYFCHVDWNICQSYADVYLEVMLSETYDVS